MELSPSSSVVRAALLVALEAVALLAAAVVYAVVGLRGDAESVVGTEIGALLLAVSGVLLLLVARGLVRRHRRAFAPAVAVQLLAGLTSFSLLETLPGVAVVGLVGAGVALYQLVTPESRQAFGPPG